MELRWYGKVVIQEIWWWSLGKFSELWSWEFWEEEVGLLCVGSGGRSGFWVGFGSGTGGV